MADYHINPSAGSDTNPGTLLGPFATVAHALTVWSPGDRFLLARGFKYPVVHIDRQDGTLADPYTWDAYGIGDDPVISAFIQPSGSWISEGGNLWSYFNASLSQVNVLSIGTTHQQISRWPERATAEYYDIDAASSNTSITDNTNLAAAPDFVGGELVSKKLKWTIDRSTITAQTSSTITVSGSGGNFVTGNGYFVQNHKNACTFQNAWAYDSATDKVYIYSTTDPNSSDINISLHQYAINIERSDYHIFNNIGFEGAYDHNIFLDQSNHVTFDNCFSRLAGKNGLQTFVASNCTWTNGAMYDINNHGINNRDASTDLTVLNSSFVRIAAVPGMGQSGNGQQCGIFLNNTEHNANLQDNYFYQIGNCGIYYRGNNCYVAHNYAEKCGFTVGDAAAFYTFGNFSTPYTNIICEYNIAYDCLGNVDGMGAGRDAFDTCGFYSDDNTKNLISRFNYAEKCAYGYYIHNNQDTNYNNNYSYDNLRGFYLSDDNAQGSGSTLRIRNIDIQNNTIKALAGQKLIALRTIQDFAGDDPFLYGTIDNNQLDAVDAEPFNVHLTFNYDTDFSLADWRSTYGFDTNSNTDPYDHTKTIYLVNTQDTAQDFELSAIYEDWDAVQYDQGTISLDPNHSVLLFYVADLAIHTLTLSVQPSGSGSVTGGGDYAEGATVPLVATPFSGWTFAYWMKDSVEISQNASFSYTMPAADASITAFFEFTGSVAEIPQTLDMELAANKIFRTVQANADNYADGNYELYGELRVETAPGSSIFSRTLTMRLSPDASDKATFELQDGIADFFPLPDFNPYTTTALALTDDNQVRAQFYTAESYGDPAELQPLSLADTFRVLNGGIAKIHDIDFFGDYLPQSRQFLTWHPGRKRITAEQPEILHYYVPSGISSLSYRLKVYFADQTSQSSLISETTGIQEARIYRMPSGYTALGVNAIDPTKKVIKYEVWLEDQDGTTVAQPFTYLLDPISPPNSRYWLFTNSLGMWEIIRTEGKTTENMGLDREISSGYLQQGYVRSRGELRIRIMGSTSEMEVSSGYLSSKEEAQWAKELLLSEKVFLLTPQARIPYVILTESYEISRDQEYNWYLRFEARQAYNDIKTDRI